MRLEVEKASYPPAPAQPQTPLAQKAEGTSQVPRLLMAQLMQGHVAQPTGLTQCQSLC